MKRKEKYQLKRMQLNKFNVLAKRLSNYFEKELQKQEGNEVSVSRRYLKWFIDIAKEGNENDK